MSEANPRIKEKQRYAPRQGLPELPAPLPGRIRLLQYSGGSLCSPPAKLPAPFQGACAYLKKERWRIHGIMYLVTRTFDCTRWAVLCGGNQSGSFIRRA